MVPSSSNTPRGAAARETGEAETDSTSIDYIPAILVVNLVNPRTGEKVALGRQIFRRTLASPEFTAPFSGQPRRLR